MRASIDLKDELMHIAKIGGDQGQEPPLIETHEIISQLDDSFIRLGSSQHTDKQEDTTEKQHPYFQTNSTGG